MLSCSAPQAKLSSYNYDCTAEKAFDWLAHALSVNPAMSIRSVSAALSCMLACLLHPAVGQDNPSALTMARTIVNSTSLELITEGDHQPSFTGRKGSSKLIKYWAKGANVEKAALPNGAVKLMTPPDDSTVTLKFSAIVRVRAGHRLGMSYQRVMSCQSFTRLLLALPRHAFSSNLRY
jgi:hypothetical protein